MQYTLHQLNTLVQRAVANSLPAAYWLTAELASVNDRGHMYGELVQKDEAGATVASARCTCWQGAYSGIRNKFYQATGGHLRAGMQVMLQVRATFHPQYGFAYNIVDIDPAYTLGDAARRRQEILCELQRQGIMRSNEANNPLPAVIQRIAVVSSPTAAGYGDFCDQLLSNKFHLRFMPTLFPA
ncbi:MAG: exodeoxyribonuclease VII large subunit, partial [Bacteroidaceae bacterium]|nr:exodeoxyribonuclease VII large subunit [Bacteroidaceae bacterium]